MAERNYAETPICDSLGIRAVIDGLATDLQDLRNGGISPADALARANLAKQYFNGARLVMAALRVTEPQPPHRTPIQERIEDA